MNIKLLVLFGALPLALTWNGAGIRNHPADLVATSKNHDEFIARAPAKTDYIRPCYFTNWAQYRQGRAKYLPQDYIPGLCTHILFAFGWMNEDFTVRAYDPADLPNDWAGDGMYKRVNALKNSDPRLKTLLSIGGWSFGTRLFQSMTASASSRKIFIDSAIDFVRTWGFDGIDVDWEYPSGNVDMVNFVALIKELRAACELESRQTGKDRLLVTAAVSAGEQTINAGYNVPSLADSFDFILLMSYDFFGAWESLIGFNSPLYASSALPNIWNTWNVDWAAKHWHNKGMPKEKIIIGMPTYGRGWTVSSSANAKPGGSGSPAKVTKYVQEAGVASYYEICEMLDSGATRYWDQESQVPYLVNGDQFWSYDDEESFSNKMAWLKREGYGGAFVWTLDFDDFNAKCSLSNGKKYPLISVIAKELGGIDIGASTAQSPTTTTTTTEKPTTTTTTPAPTTTTKPTTICTGRANGHYAYTSSCTTFLLCLNEVPFTMSCPSGLEYAKPLGYCVSAEESKCEIATTTTIAPSTTTTEEVSPTTTAATTTTKNKFDCTKNGFFGVPQDCTKFVRCVNGIAYYFKCPDGLKFNINIQVCDRSDNCA
ncbi:unnamed protein product [Caenorhabditis bovis]|uniref:Chitinase n=1 Tax=Caenorhabditis bovis TaxID=2654633 RepID=A0A8S1EJZ6_9PELO|nr:unnamed protein product [Caenorhabditis bovis]